jgi:hypothetical protein
LSSDGDDDIRYLRTEPFECGADRVLAPNRSSPFPVVAPTGVLRPTLVGIRTTRRELDGDIRRPGVAAFRE